MDQQPKKKLTAGPRSYQNLMDQRRAAHGIASANAIQL
jgi:hypothetical protein